MKTIEIIVAPNGQTSVETKGFTGTECRQASEFIETALGRQSREQLTSEFYTQQSEPQRLQEGT
jgi:hypothetical protein